MAKQRATIDAGLFANTEAGAPVEVPADGPTKNMSVGMKQSEAELIEGIAAEFGVSMNAIMRYGLRYFLRDYLAGRVDLASDVRKPPPPKNILDMP